MDDKILISIDIAATYFVLVWLRFSVVQPGSVGRHPRDSDRRFPVL
jgi:hypothetical protein